MQGEVPTFNWWFLTKKRTIGLVVFQVSLPYSVSLSIFVTKESKNNLMNLIFVLYNKGIRYIHFLSTALGYKWVKLCIESCDLWFNNRINRSFGRGNTGTQPRSRQCDPNWKQSMIMLRRKHTACSTVVQFRFRCVISPIKQLNSTVS